MKIIIPTREGSKGFPFKNRLLFKNTTSIIPINRCIDTYVTTDDVEIKKMAKNNGFNVIDRSDILSSDDVSIKEVMKDVVNIAEIKDYEIILMLYLTYPQRKWSDIEDAMNFFAINEAESLLCRKEINWTPYLILKEEDNHRGSQLFKHNLYRRQDYDKCFELSHFISIFRVRSINKLNNNLYNKDTIFMKIPSETIDVDYEKDLKEYNDTLRNK